MGYPFDTQTCNMEFSIKNEFAGFANLFKYTNTKYKIHKYTNTKTKYKFAGFAKLIPGTVDYLQAMPENDLYFIQDTRSNERVYFQNLRINPHIKKCSHIFSLNFPQ